MHLSVIAAGCSRLGEAMLNCDQQDTAALAGFAMRTSIIVGEDGLQRVLLGQLRPCS